MLGVPAHDHPEQHAKSRGPSRFPLQVLVPAGFLLQSLTRTSGARKRFGKPCVSDSSEKPELGLSHEACNEWRDGGQCLSVMCAFGLPARPSIKQS
jgi:hypothetical protein